MEGVKLNCFHLQLEPTLGRRATMETSENLGRA